MWVLTRNKGYQRMKIKMFSNDRPNIQVLPLIIPSCPFEIWQVQSFENISISGLRSLSPLTFIVSCLLRMYKTLLKTLCTPVYQDITTQTVFSLKMIDFKTLFCYNDIFLHNVVFKLNTPVWHSVKTTICLWMSSQRISVGCLSVRWKSINTIHYSKLQ